MQKKVNDCLKNSMLEDNVNFKVVGFYDPIGGLKLDEADMLQVVYSVNGKYYVMYEDNDMMANIFFYLDMIMDTYQGDKEKMYHDISEFMSHFQADVINESKYSLTEIDINKVHNLIPFDKYKVLMPDDFMISRNCFYGAVLVSEGVIALGNKGFLEKAILNNVQNKKRRYELLESLYYDYYDFEKREAIINDFYCEFYNDADEFEKKMWDNKRLNNYLTLYAIGLLGTLNVDFKEANVPETIEDKKVL